MDVPALAKRCPHCRSKLPQPTSLLVKILLGVIVFAVLTSIFSSSSSNPTPPAQQVTDSTTKASYTDSVPTVQQKEIPYEIVKRWTIPNGGEGKVILIAPEYLNEADMLALGEKIKSDVQSDRNAFISVFDDRKAANVRDKVLADTATPAETDLYDKHYIGDYKKNGNTGFHEFSIFFDGVMGTNHKTVTY